MTGFDWLPERSNWEEDLKAARRQAFREAIDRFQQLAATRMDFVRTEKLDRALRKYLAEHPGEITDAVRIAMIGSSTLSHLAPGIRIGCLRRGLIAEIYEGGYGSFRQELADAGSLLYSFQPHVLLLSLDAQHLTAADSSSCEASLETMRWCWQMARERLHCAVIQQTVLPRGPLLLGNNEHRGAGCPCAVAAGINHALRDAAAENGVHLLAIDRFAYEQGMAFWHDPALWHRAKQEVHPRAGAIYGDQVGRLVAALRGKSRKCLVLDLDNTLWGGVIGDDGLSGLVLGNGHAAGEAFLAFQRYVQALSRRGVILAVCSKNDAVNALLPFESHPEMVLKKNDIAVFVANWEDKAHNLRDIARQLNIGLDAMVFADDNPAERALVRRELPMVAVPELPEDPAYFADCLSTAGYFEALALTEEDRDRTSQYRANAQRDELLHAATDMESFLRDLKMELAWRPFANDDLARVVQLINKTNQFNLTTRRYLEPEVKGFISDPLVLTLQFRLLDVYGNNGIIAIVIGQLDQGTDLRIDTWLMSCRVLGREVEAATLNVLAGQARTLGAARLIGEYRPTAKNGMVREHYQRLGFTQLAESPDGSTRWALELAAFEPRKTYIEIYEEQDANRHLQAAN